MADAARKRPDPSGDYDRDFFDWTQAQARALRERRFSDIDIEHIAEELETLGRSDRRELQSRLIVILTHLLKWRHQPEQRSSHWTGTLIEQRQQMDVLLDDSPSLRRFPQEKLAGCYAAARLRASAETGLPLERFPAACPFTIDDVLAVDFLPE